MKTLLILLASTMLSIGVSAQRKGVYYHAYAPRVVVVPSFNYGLAFGYPYFGYPFYYSPYGWYGPNYYYGNRSYSLSMEIQSIRENYRNKIKNVKHEKSLSHAKKRSEIRSLKAERDHQISVAQKNYYDYRRQGYFYKNGAPNNNQNNQQNRGSNNNSENENNNGSSGTNS
jgi:hypothetical protein